MFEFAGILTLISAVLILISLISYDPNDPNFIYPESQKINNILGIKGSISADFLFQSIGLISYFIPITLVFVSTKIFFQKKINSILKSLFYIVCYSLVGTIFLTQFYNEAFFLIINGNGGFVGNYLYNEIFFKVANINNEISYYFQLLIFTIFFLQALTLN